MSDDNKPITLADLDALDLAGLQEAGLSAKRDAAYLEECRAWLPRLSRELRERIEREKELARIGSKEAWARWYEECGGSAEVDVVNATKNLVTAEREIYAAQPQGKAPEQVATECLMADCRDPQEHFCFKHCVEVFVPSELAAQVFARREEKS